MATYQTYQSIGNREDLTNIITTITPVDTWFTSTSGTAKAKGTYHEWQTDALAAAAANAKVEGAATSAGSVTPTVRAGNYTQILEKAFQIANTEETIDKAGRKSEMAYQTMKHMKELARDIEYALLLNSAVASGASGTARELNGVNGWIATNVETGTATGDEDLIEDMFNDALQTIWAAGGFPKTCVSGAFQKRTISAFTTNTRYMVADENKLASAVDIYQSDFGTVTIRLHHQMQTTLPGTVFIFGDMDLWAKAWLRGVKKQREPFAGDAELWTMRTELTLESKQEKGSGSITQLNTS
jgi:hypothetical protein